MNIGVYSNKLNDEFLSVWRKISSVIQPLECKIWLADSVRQFLLQHSEDSLMSRCCLSSPKETDVLISVGGDGTFLEAVSLVIQSKIPVLGVNTGRLGFLADVYPKELESVLHNYIKGDFYVENRSLLKAKLMPESDILLPRGLNEVTVHKRDTSSMIRIHTYIDDVLLTSYWADGLIIATPTGSTAYSMSAGGPIVSPESNTMVITPIASHNLTIRPLVIPNHHKLRLQVESRDAKYLLSVDSKSWAIDEPLEILITKAEECAKFIKFNNYNFFNNIQKKLLWGIDKRK